MMIIGVIVDESLCEIFHFWIVDTGVIEFETIIIMSISCMQKTKESERKELRGGDMGL